MNRILSANQNWRLSPLPLIRMLRERSQGAGSCICCKYTVRSIVKMLPGSHLGDNLFFQFNANHTMKWASHMVLVVKNPPANAGDIRDMDSIPGLGRSPEGVHGNRLYYSCLENPMDREAWQFIVHRIKKTQIWLKQFSRHPWAVAHQALLFMRFPRQEYCSELPFYSLGDLPDQSSNPSLLQW